MKAKVIGLGAIGLLAIFACIYMLALQKENVGLVEELQALDREERPRSFLAPSRKLGEAQVGNQRDNAGDEASHEGIALDESHSSHSLLQQEHGYQHDGLIFLVGALLVGTCITHLKTVTEALHGLHYTVVLFILGLSYSAAYYGLHLEGKVGILGRSHDMWMRIDPNVLIFAVIPALLTGDAMVIDTTVAKRVAAQCIYLALPGVFFTSLLTGLFLWHFLHGWPIMLCMTLGAMLAATAPVDVVGLLKELGASPTLTAQIQGESLLNDGTAVVLFKVTYDILCGTDYDLKSVCIHFVYMAVCSWFLGMVIGGFFASWINAASNRLERDSNLIQIALTICCAYVSFVFAEGVLGISGVLCTVAASLMLADSIWPRIVSQEAMHEVWRMLEYIGNTLIFFVAGALTGKTMTKIEPMDYVNLLIIYIVIMVIRALMFFLSRPALQRLSPDRNPISIEDTLVMTWGGLRGATGLAIAIQVSSERASGVLTQSQADRVMFFTGGIAALTLIVNATTFPKLLDLLGITATTRSKQRMMLNIHSRLEEKSVGHSSRVAVIIDKLLSTIQHNIQHECAIVQSPSASARSNTVRGKEAFKGHECQCGGKFYLCEAKVLANFEKAKAEFTNVPEHHLQLLGWDSNQPLLEHESEIVDLLNVGCAEPSHVRSINESYLSLVRSEYWRQIRRGEFVEGTRCADILLGSSTAAYQFSYKGLLDYRHVQHRLGMDRTAISVNGRDVRTSGNVGFKEGGFFAKLIDSIVFQACMIIVIVANTIVVLIEGDSSVDQSLQFLIIDCVFVLVYVLEFVLKISVLHGRYFRDGWNAVDFMCVILGLFGITTKIVVEVASMSQDAVTSEMQLLRLNRVFKFMRLMRVVVVVKFIRKVHAKIKGKVVSPELALHLEKIFALKAFVQAHTSAQAELLRFLGCESGGVTKFDECEEARCILESWTQMYWAVVDGSAEIRTVEEETPWMLGGMAVLEEAAHRVEGLTEFVVSAAKAGILKEGEAETLMHPLQNHLRSTRKAFADCHAGVHRTRLQEAYKIVLETCGNENNDLRDLSTCEGDSSNPCFEDWSLEEERVFIVNPTVEEERLCCLRAPVEFTHDDSMRLTNCCGKKVCDDAESSANTNQRSDQVAMVGPFSL